MYETRLCIAGQLAVDVRCDVDACVDGLRALLALFEHPASRSPSSLNLSIAGIDDDIELRCNGRHIWQGKEAGEIVAAFEWTFYNECIAVLFPRYVSLHAATVLWQGNGISIAGASGAGKSSLCTAALLAGAEYFSDEYSLLDEDGCITPFPRPLQWDGEEHPAFARQGMQESGLFNMGGYAFTAHDGRPVRSLLWLPKRLARTPARLSMLLLPRFDAAAAGASCESLPRSQALMELAAEMHHRLPVGERLRELHHRIPADTRIVRLVFADVHAAWQRVGELLAADQSASEPTRQA